MLALKCFYSQAGAAALEWMLGPPCWLAARLGGIDLVQEQAAGWISHSHHLIVGAACAGINFLIVCFAMLFFSFQARVRSVPGVWAWLGVSAALAYLAAIIVNAVRIVAAAHLYALALPPGALTPERLHRAAGTTIYCLGFAATYATVSAGFAMPRVSIAPFLWYLAIALGLPWLHARLTHTALAQDFAEHALTVFAVAVLLALALQTVRLRAKVKE
jgi:exosortase K